jgi:hypothetical protein
MEIVDVLVAVEHPTAVGGVVRVADGDVWLTWSVEQVGGPRLDDYRPDHVGLEDERTLLGGRLPAGAVAATVLDDNGDRVPAQVGDGAWAVVLEQPTAGERSPVCFRDRDGAPVAPALPAGWPRTPVTDTEECCPACGALAWDVVVPADASRGSRGAHGGSEPTPVIVCRVCGHEVVMGSIMRTSTPDDEDPAEVRERIRHAEEMRRLSHQMLLSAVTFPVYAAEGIPGRVGGSGSRGDDVTSVRVTHGGDGRTARPTLEVETRVTERRPPSSERTLAADALARRLEDERRGWSGGSDAAFVLSLRATARARRELARRATATERIIGVDATPTPFTYVQAGSRWAAVASAGAVTITVTGVDLDPEGVQLRTVEDPVTSLI